MELTHRDADEREPECTGCYGTGVCVLVKVLSRVQMNVLSLRAK